MCIRYRLSVDISQNEKKNFTLNMVVNSILNSKISVMQENSITYNFKINIPPNLGIDDKDIVTLIGNILDNAIEAELKIDGERYISLNIQYFNNSIIIICENKVDKKVVSLKSLKPDTLYHGLGLKSIDKIAQKYSGSKRIISTENVFRIEVNLWSTI